MAASEWTFLPFPPFKLPLPVGLYLGNHALLDSVLFPSSPSSSSTSVRKSPFISPGLGAHQTHLPPTDPPKYLSQSSGCSPCRMFALAWLHKWSNGGANFQ